MYNWSLRRRQETGRKKTKFEELMAEIFENIIKSINQQNQSSVNHNKSHAEAYHDKFSENQWQREKFERIQDSGCGRIDIYPEDQK